MPKSGISKAQFDTGCAIARKTIQLLGLPPIFFDMFTKKQKHALLDIEIPVPVIRVKNGHRVPRQYVNAIRTSAMNFMRTHYIDENVQLTYMEFFTYSLPFMFSIKQKYDKELFTVEQKSKFIGEMLKKLGEINLINSGWFKGLFTNIWFELGFYSQINFRTYGFEFKTDIPRPKALIGTAATIRCVFELTSQESESIHFTYKNIKRKAFNVLVGTTFLPVFYTSTIKHHELYPESKSQNEYKIYVQSHAIHRFKERIDIADATTRNYLMHHALTIDHKVVKSANGRPLMSCSVYNVSLGYYPFTIQGDKLFILSFLPVVCSITPEGKKLYDILKFTKDELVYLGMDKLSFFLTVDFEEIPILKNALIESGLWALKQRLDTIPRDENDANNINGIKTRFIKNFFQKTETKIQNLIDDETKIEEWI
jgi:hypothetical protein